MKAFFLGLLVLGSVAHAAQIPVNYKPPQIQISTIMVSSNLLGECQISGVALWQDLTGKTILPVKFFTNETALASVATNYVALKPILIGLLNQSCSNAVFFVWPSNSFDHVTIPLGNRAATNLTRAVVNGYGLPVSMLDGLPLTMEALFFP